ncbi:DUF4350 domain-containing protein [Croceibacterium aestuarii]|uniref:DUF4350 domain-containing protein n=1 Tax=Croceibacterium aestuarii TaxID=3064139 RepID=UPI00272ED91C|nr:DUF4350 domain-containing protein [Croceibacterium sp. D39]
MSRPGSPFDPRVVLAVVAVGAATFLLFLYALGAGWTGGDRATGSGHAASKALNGYAALYALLDRRGYDVSMSRNRGTLDADGLLVLTPPHFIEAKGLAELLAKRRLQGPTLLIMPKWFGFDARRFSAAKDAPRGWVIVSNPESPPWAGKIGLPELDLELRKEPKWRARGANGAMPAPGAVQTIEAPAISALVRGSDGRVLAAYREDGGDYRALREWSDATSRNPAALERARQRDRPIVTLDAAPTQGSDPAEDYWPLVVVADPDLLNNSGMADPDRARLAVDLVEATIDGYDLPVVFDLTLAGLGSQQNLLTLAFEPPFLAATLTLLLAALVIGWRSFVRFGPPRQGGRELAGGKAQLARDGALLIERGRRFALVGAPYAALVARRIGRALGMRDTAPPAIRRLAIVRALERRGEDRDGFDRASEVLKAAHRPADLLRAAQALNTIERTLRR